MPRTAAPLPPHLEELISVLEKQDTPERVKAVRAVEEKHGVEIDLDMVIAEHEAFAARYLRWRRRLNMGLEDKADAAALEGRASAAAILRGRGLLKAAGAGNQLERPLLGREHRARVAAAKRGW
jgi:hypothetical protein